MGRNLLSLIIGTAVGLAVAVGLLAGAPSRDPGWPYVSERPSKYAQTVQLQDGLYRLADGGVTCKVVDGWIACSNRRVQILCIADRCKAHYLDLAPEPYSIVMADEESNDAKVLPPRTLLELPSMTCATTRRHIECRVADYLGGFQMSGIFARNVDWDDAPDGWPWDGRDYTVRDRVPGI